MAAQLSRLAPLNFLLKLAKLLRLRFELPNDNHLVVAAACQPKPVRREPKAVYCLRVTSRQVVLIRDLEFAVRLVAASFNLPELDATILERLETRRGEPQSVRIKVTRDQLILLVVPGNLRYVYLH